MSDKTFRVRIEDEVQNFPAIYAGLLAAYKARTETLRADGNEAPDPWDYSFEIPFESSIKQYIIRNPQERGDFIPSSRHDAVIDAIHELELDELHLGALSFSDTRISAALELGLLTVDDLAPLYTLPEKDQRELKMGPVTRAKPDRGDPFFWRALLEIFCRAYIASPGRRPWPLTRKIDLAFDLDEIRQSLPERKWNKEAVLKVLRSKEPYRTKYPPSGSASSRAGVGEDRVQEITDWIGPMDDGALHRLKTKYDAIFFEVAEKRWAQEHRPKNLAELKRKLEEADEIVSEPPTTRRGG